MQFAGRLGIYNNYFFAVVIGVTPFNFFGLRIHSLAAVLREDLAEKLYSVSFKNLHLLALSHRPLSERRFRHLSKFSSCSLLVAP